MVHEYTWIVLTSGFASLSAVLAVLWFLTFTSIRKRLSTGTLQLALESEDRTDVMDEIVSDDNMQLIREENRRKYAAAKAKRSATVKAHTSGNPDWAKNTYDLVWKDNGEKPVSGLDHLE